MPSLKQLTYCHPEHQQNNERWKLLDALVSGGHKVTDDIKRQLLVNPDNRPGSVMAERVKLARYYNKIGPILNRFLSQLFAAPIQYEGSKDKWWQEQFFPNGALLDGDDDGRSSLTAFLRSATLAALTTGKAIAQIDTAIADGILTKADQKRKRVDEPYVLLVPRTDLWDWASDRDGFKFAKIHRFRMGRDSWDADAAGEHDFTIYQRKPNGAIAASRYVVKAIKPETDISNIIHLTEENTKIETILENKEIFSRDGEYAFPIATLTLPDNLCIANQLFDPQVSHFNQTAALEWGLVNSNYAMACITTEDPDEFFDQNKRFGEGFYLALKPGESVSWLERPGGAFDTSIGYRGKIEEDIDRTVQQIALSAADAVTTQSGEAIRQARKPEQILLSTYGSLVKEFDLNILKAAAIARGEKVNWRIQGFEDFEEVNLSGASQEFQTVTAAQIPSETFTKSLQKSFAREVGKQKEFDSADMKKILDEIEAAKAEAEPPAEGEDPATEPEDVTDDGEDSTDATIDEVLNDPKLLDGLK